MERQTDRTDTLLTVSQARTHIPVGATTMQGYIKSGRLRSVKVGGRRLIPESAVREFIANLSGQPAA